MNLISIVIPACDRSDKLKLTLDSVCIQEYSNFEVIIVENNSVFPEKIKSLIESYKDDRFFLFNLKPCNNANIARNFGVKKAHGNYIAFLDSDDIWCKNHLSNSINLININKCDFVYGGALILTGKQVKIKKARKINTNESALDYLLGWQKGHGQTSSYFMRKIVTDFVTWDESLKRNQDLDYFNRIIKKGISLCHSDIITTKITWIRGEKRSYDVFSMLAFFEKNNADMKKTTAFRYFLISLKTIIQNKDVMNILGFAKILFSRITK